MEGMGFLLVNLPQSQVNLQASRKLRSLICLYTDWVHLSRAASPKWIRGSRTQNWSRHALFYGDREGPGVRGQPHAASPRGWPGGLSVRELLAVTPSASAMEAGSPSEAGSPDRLCFLSSVCLFFVLRARFINGRSLGRIQLKVVLCLARTFKKFN